MTSQVVVATGPFPSNVFIGARSALFLFGAAFLGANDAVWARDARVRSTVVDVDRAKLEEMRPLYPAGWRFVCADAFDFARAAKRRWDVVVLDPFTGDTGNRCLTHLHMFDRLANDALIVTVASGVRTAPLPGWKALIMPRSRRADWLVLTR